jgi:hypothetical protein
MGDVYAGGWLVRGPEACGYRHHPRTSVSQQPLGDMNGVFPPLDWEERPAPDHRRIRAGRVGNPVRGKAPRVPVRAAALSHTQNVFIGFSRQQREALHPVRFLVPTATGAWQNIQQPVMHRKADGTTTVGGHNAGHGTRYKKTQDQKGNWVWGTCNWNKDSGCSDAAWTRR